MSMNISLSIYRRFLHLVFFFLSLLYQEVTVHTLTRPNLVHPLLPCCNLALLSHLSVIGSFINVFQPDIAQKLCGFFARIPLWDV